MFEVLVFVYENYYATESCPEPESLERKLNAVGFDADEIEDALCWLRALRSAAKPAAPTPWLHQPHPHSMRIYPLVEQIHLGAACLAFLRFLEASGAMSAHMREVIIDRAMAAPGAPVALDDFKIIVLMVYWNFGQVPDALLLDELCDDSTARVAH